MPTYQTCDCGQSVIPAWESFLPPPPLPTADPHIAGRIYISAGTLKVSAG